MKGRFDGNTNDFRTFEDLKGLRAEGYIRDSTLDQRDGSGPEIQRHIIGDAPDVVGDPT